MGQYIMIFWTIFILWTKKMNMQHYLIEYEEFPAKMSNGYSMSDSPEGYESSKQNQHKFVIEVAKKESYGNAENTEKLDWFVGSDEEKQQNENKNTHDNGKQKEYENAEEKNDKYGKEDENKGFSSQEEKKEAGRRRRLQ